MMAAAIYAKLVGRQAKSQGVGLAPLENPGSRDEAIRVQVSAVEVEPQLERLASETAEVVDSGPANGPG
jgi:hypothetical protein